MKLKDQNLNLHNFMIFLSKILCGHKFDIEIYVYEKFSWFANRFY